MVFLRRDLGYRFLSPFKLIAVMGGLAVVAILETPGNEDARTWDLGVFAVIGFALGVYQRLRRWADLNNGVARFSYYIGSSPFDFSWLPNFMRRNRRVARYCDPVFCALIGLALFPYSRALAMWLVFSALCLRSFEDQVFQRERHRDLDILDSLLIAEDQIRTMDAYQQAQGVANHQPEQGVPSGVGDDIEGQIQISIKRRKPKSTKPIIDI